jgi:diguanylate cyclase (GGDEF)-like protein/PAS domain S-box-containing protein
MTLNLGRMGQLPSWLASPVFEGDEEKTYQAGLVNIIVLASIAFACAVMVSGALDGTMPFVTLIIDLVACLVMIQFLLWLRRGRVAWARLGLVIFGLVYLTAATASLGSICRPTAAIFTFWVLMVGVLFDLRGIVLGTVGASLAILGLIVAENAHWLVSPSQGSSVSDWVTYTALFAFTSGLTYYINQGTKRALMLAQTEVVQRQQTEIQLYATQNKLQGIINGLPDLLLEVSLDGVIHNYRSPCADLLATTPEAFLGKNLFEFLPREAAQRMIDAIQEAARSGLSSGTTFALEQPDGTRWFELSVSAKPGCDEQDQRFICLSRDATMRRRAEDALLVSEKRHRLLADNARDIVWSITGSGLLSYISPAVETVLGFTQDEVRQQTMEVMFAPTSFAVWLAYIQQLKADCSAGNPPESFRQEILCRCKDGSTVWTDVMAHPMFNDEGLVEIVGVSRNITEHKRLMQELQQAHDVAQAAKQALQSANEELSKIAITDPLTGVYNRRHFIKVADTQRAQVQRYLSTVSMLIFDIDHFKSINDNYGHPTGDRVLIEITQLVSSALRQGDVLARWGGEEFVVIMPQCDALEAMQLAEKLRALIAAHPFAEVRTVTVSLGVAEFKPGELLDDWFKRVDLALYAAKSSGRNMVRLAA